MGTRFSKCQDHESIQISPSRAIANSPTPLFIKRGELQLAKQIEKGNTMTAPMKQLRGFSCSSTRISCIQTCSATLRIHIKIEVKKKNLCNSYSEFWNYSHLCSIYKILALSGSLVRAKGKLWSSIKLDQEESSPTHCSYRNYQVLTLQDWTKAHVFWGWACQGLNTPTGCALHLHWACTVCARSYPCKLASDTSSWRRAKRSQIKEWSLPPFAWELLLCSGYCSWGTPQPRQSLATFLPDPDSLTWLPGFNSDLPYHWELSRSLLGCGWPLLLMPDHSLPPPWSQPLLPAPLPQQRILSLAACSDCTLKSMESSPDKEYCRAGMIPIIILLNGEMRARATWILFSLSFLQSPGEDKMKTNKQKRFQIHLQFYMTACFHQAFCGILNSLI